jgi:hydrogenase-4 component F
MLHAVNHSLAKAMLFLVAGNILGAYRSKSSRDVRGVGRTLPISGALWVAGFLAITGSPPFGTFLSEFTILKAALDDHRGLVAAAYLALLAVAFVGMATSVLRMAQGTPTAPVAEPREPALAVVPPAVLGLAVLVLGVYVPAPLGRALQEVARTFTNPN